MQLRFRKNTISLVRSVYDPALKRCRAVTVGQLARDATDVPAGIAALLTEQELQSVQVACANNAQQQQHGSAEAAAKNLAPTLKAIADWYRKQSSSEELTQLAESARLEWTEVLAAMVVAGVGRTRKRKHQGDEEE